MSNSLGIGPVVQPPRYANSDGAAPAPPANAWGKPKAAASPVVGPPSGQSAGTSLLSSALGGGSASMGRALASQQLPSKPIIELQKFVAALCGSPRRHMVRAPSIDDSDSVLPVCVAHV